MDDQKALTAKEISAIVVSCGESGVKTLEYRDLKLAFFGQETDISQRHPETIHYPAQSFEPTLPSDPDFDDEPEDLDLLAVEDPVRWQEMKTRNEI